MATTTRADRYWSALRSLPTAAVLRALGSGSWEVYDDPAHGVSIRRPGGEWDWPEWALAELHGIEPTEARQRLLAEGRKHWDRRIRMSRHEAAVERFNELRAVR